VTAALNRRAYEHLTEQSHAINSNVRKRGFIHRVYPFGGVRGENRAVAFLVWGKAVKSADQYSEQDFDREAAQAAKYIARWSAEIALLALIAPAPKYRWQLAVDAGISIDDFTSDDGELIYRAFFVAHEHGPRICALLIRNLLIEDGFWDKTDSRPFVASSAWGPGPLACIFNRSIHLRNEREVIARALRMVRSLPAIPKLKAAA
jgi:hypothetical protein